MSVKELNTKGRAACGLPCPLLRMTLGKPDGIAL